MSTAPTRLRDHRAPSDTAALLSVRGLQVHLGRGADTSILRDVDLDVGPGDIVGLIGETGSGKTTLARAILGLVPIRAGRVVLADTTLSALNHRQRRAFGRTGQLQYVFQDPLSSLDPDRSVGDSVGEGLAVRGVPRAERRRRVAAALRQVGLDPALTDRRPAHLSGGQRQRAAIARAIVLRPRLLICDEPVSAMDLSNRNRILRLLARLREELSMSIVVISHDLAALAGVADRIAVLYQGRLVEDGPPERVFTAPTHPYTQLLVASIPDRDEPPERRRALRAQLDQETRVGR